MNIVFPLSCCVCVDLYLVCTILGSVSIVMLDRGDKSDYYGGMAKKTRAPQLTHMQKAFIDAYLGAAGGNGTLAAEIAGYGAAGARNRAAELLQHPMVRAELRKAAQDGAKKIKLKDIRGFWAEIMQDSSVSYRERIKASELLAKSIGAFDTVRRVEHRHAHLHAEVGSLSDGELARIAGQAVTAERALPTRNIMTLPNGNTDEGIKRAAAIARDALPLLDQGRGERVQIPGVTRRSQSDRIVYEQGEQKPNDNAGISPVGAPDTAPRGGPNGSLGISGTESDPNPPPTKNFAPSSDPPPTPPYLPEE